MAAFETIVRPVILPSIRPPRALPNPPQDDPESGKAVIAGSGGSVIDLPFSYSVNVSRSKKVERKRLVDNVRVYQVEEDGTINRENFVDIDVMKRVWMGETGESRVDTSGPGGGTPGAGQGTPGVGYTEEVYTYKPVEEKDNIEVLKRDVLKYPYLVEGGDPIP